MTAEPAPSRDGLRPAVGYVRVSTAREQMISPELQRASVEKAAAEDGFYIDRWIEELDISGRGFARKGVQEAINLVADGTYRRVYVWKYSRFGRNATLVGVNVDKLEHVGGRNALRSATEPVDVSTAAGKLHRGMLWQFDEFQSNVIGESWQETHAKRHKDGLPHSGAPRFGYLYHRPSVPGGTQCPQGCEPKACNAGYVPDPATRDACAGMYAAYNSGQSVLKISVDLNTRGFTTPAGKPWDQRSVRRYMDTGFPAGKLRVHDPACDCGKPATSCPHKVLIEGAQPQILAASDEEAAGIWAEYLRQRKERGYLPPRVETPSYPLAGLVRCGRCGGPMNTHPKTDRAGVYHPGYLYQCALYMRSRGCAGSWMARHRVEDVTLAWLHKLTGDEVWRDSVVRKIAAARDQGTARDRLAAEREKLSKALARLTTQYGLEVVSEDAYKLASADIEARLKEIGGELGKLAAEPPVPATPPFEIAASLAEKWLVFPVTVKRQMLAQLIDHIAITSHGRGRGSVSIAARWGEVYLYDI